MNTKTKNEQQIASTKNPVKLRYPSVSLGKPKVKSLSAKVINLISESKIILNEAATIDPTN